MAFDLNESLWYEFPFEFEQTFQNDPMNSSGYREQEIDVHINSDGIEDGRVDYEASLELSVAELSVADVPVDENVEGEDARTNADDAEATMDENEDFDDALRVRIEDRLAPGSKLQTLDQVYLLYCEYGRIMGFSVKKGTQSYYTKGDEVPKKNYFCSCHGKSNSSQTNERLHVYRKQVSRTNCKARLTVVKDSDGTWEVSKFLKEHNHELVDREHGYLLRSARQMSAFNKSLIEALQSAGIRLSNACRFMEKEAGGPANCGFVRKDAYHHMDNVRRKSKLEDADSSALIQHFAKMSNKENFFFWKIQTDDEGRLMNVFYRDSRCLIDYQYFGDVVSVDTTYKTNKYDLKCAPFIGVNHHMKSCFFGLAFLSDETTSTFEWLFSAFLESMNGKEPAIIFSDQSQALMNGIESQFPRSSHRLCQWHINRNAPSHFGSLNTNDAFRKKLFECMKGCETISEWERTWSSMISDHGLVDNHWFRDMYNLRKRWCNVFTRDKFCAGLHATSRSENTNKVLKQLSSRSGSLYEFVMNYEQVQMDWRRLEGQHDTASLGVPGLLVANNPLLNDAAKFFTRAVFLSYEYEATYTINREIEETLTLGEGSDEVVFVVSDSSKKTRTRRVLYDRMKNEAFCSCSLWENVGVMCSHIFKVLMELKIHTIPPKYLLKRLSKDAKKRRAIDGEHWSGSSATNAPSGRNANFKSYLMRVMYEMLHESELDNEMRSHLLGRIETVRDELRAMQKTGKPKVQEEVIERRSNVEDRPPCRDPPLPADRRHTNTRLSRHWEKPRRRGRKRAANEAVARSKLPIPRSVAASPSRFDDHHRATTPSSSYIEHNTGYDFATYSPRAFSSGEGVANFRATQ